MRFYYTNGGKEAEKTIDGNVFYGMAWEVCQNIQGTKQNCNHDVPAHKKMSS